MISRPEAFEILGLNSDATAAELRAAFRRKLIEHHPDTSSQSSDDSTVRGLIDAYRLLTDVVPEPPKRSARPRVHRVDPESDRPAASEPPVGSHLDCPECSATGFVARVVRCPQCRGGSVLTTLDIREVQVSRCRRCRGRGAIQAVARCDTCGGAGYVSRETRTT